MSNRGAFQGNRFEENCSNKICLNTLGENLLKVRDNWERCVKRIYLPFVDNNCKENAVEQINIGC